MSGAMSVIANVLWQNAHAAARKSGQGGRSARGDLWAASYPGGQCGRVTKAQWGKSSTPTPKVGDSSNTLSSPGDICR
jgi:hypothetical protein